MKANNPFYPITRLAITGYVHPSLYGKSREQLNALHNIGEALLVPGVIQMLRAVYAREGK